MGCGLPTDFCICVDLRKGAKIIGVTCMIFSVISSIFLLIYLCSDFESIAHELADDNEQVKQQIHSNKASTQVMASFLLAILVLYAISSVFLCKGAGNKSKKHMVPFLICTLILMITAVLVAFQQSQDGPIYASLLLAMILFYFFICVYALFNNLSREYDNDN